MSKLLQLFQNSSAFYGGNANFIEDLYEKFLEDPNSVEESWRQKFLTIHDGATYDIPHRPVKERFAQLGKISPGRLAALKGISEESIRKQSAVERLINHYRMRGHQQAANNPLHLEPPKLIPDLDPAFYGLAEPDMDTVFDTGTLYGAERLTLREIIKTLKEIYCGSIGTEYMHIVDTDVRRWIRNRLESSHASLAVSPEKKRWMLKLLTAAEGIERYLHRKYVGQKRFSLEGGEGLILILDELLLRASACSVKEIVMGMAHRGRLNVLVNILGKSPALLFEEFENIQSRAQSPWVSSGDVKYHLGFSSDIETPTGAMHVALAFNPSHLEIINPVVEGSVKARQDRRGKGAINAVVPILIHGDAAFAGQGIVMETLNMAETRAYSTGGTVHIVVNNQIGFTTSNPFDARSTLYCTDVANMVQAPVFHVNGDDPEAVLFVTQMALDYRMAFNRDVVIDLICYRRHGHNEADEPAATQPTMYKQIRNHPTTRQIYAERLIAEGHVSEEEVILMDKEYQAKLDQGQVVSRPLAEQAERSNAAQWSRYLGTDWDMPCNTAVPIETLRRLSDDLLALPPSFELHPRVAKIMENRRKMAAGALPLDWGFAENIAYATILMDGHNVRLTGQDVGRGTFFHRHAIVYNQLKGESHIPLKHLPGCPGRVQVFDSLLSEAGVLGFEYGYATAEPETLVIWEAQFGDFANNAQVVIDQFISSGETKWGRLCGLTMLLPHGYEGQGPEHSSARIERFLQLCAEQNIQVCNPTTPAQIFHLLRRQILRPFRKPLIVISPKSLLRHKLAVSSLEDLTESGFMPLIGEIDEINPKKVKRVILCSGKIFFDLLEARRAYAEELEHVAIIRVEQLYPFPLEQLTLELENYPNVDHLIWCQEEPKNQGAWYQIKHRFLDLVGENIQLSYVGRPMSAAPAVGYFSLHAEQQYQIIDHALFGTIAEPSIPSGNRQ